MKSSLYLLAALAASSPVLAGGKSCDELTREIIRKLDAHHVQQYSLETLPKNQTDPGRAVGSCEGGSKKIVYKKKSDPSNQP